MKKFPKINGKNLEGKRYSLPFDLEGKYNIVIVPFLQHQQFIVNHWTDFLEQLQKKYSFFEYYEVPTLATSYSAMRFMIDGGMRAGIPDLRTRQRTITVYLNKRKFKNKLEIDTEEFIYIYLLEGDNIIWEEKGDITDQKAHSLENFLKNINNE